MDPNYKLDFPHGFPSQPFSPFSIDFPFDGFPQFQLDLPTAAAVEGGGAEFDQFAVNQPPECSEGTLIIPPFLSKAYDLVEDPSLDPIVSWGEEGKSFVVWEPDSLATIVLPRYFKHDNFSSFVRQLNSYVKSGFRKIDPNKWEFANEFFLRGSKHLLANIQRRKSPHPQQVSSEGSGPEMETELEKLRTQKSVIMQEMAELQQQQRQAARHLETIKQKLGDSEKRQRQMVSFLGKVVQNPEFIESVIMEMKEQRLSDSSLRTRRKIVKKKAQEQVGSSEMNSSLPLQTENVSSNGLEFGHFVDLPEEFGVLENWQYDEYPVVGGINSQITFV